MSKTQTEIQSYAAREVEVGMDRVADTLSTAAMQTHFAMHSPSNAEGHLDAAAANIQDTQDAVDTVEHFADLYDAAGGNHPDAHK